MKEFTNVRREVRRKKSAVYSNNGCSGTWEACGKGEVFEGVEEAA